ncbi:3-hydroxyacyl-ACP dehydratase FabZ [Pyruvatibacter sp.]|uniref:3-hydroxyacyl-ACP dehydratase FabZ n=1 Tax=Pyruvatibacter sp. TaxID=1981328 RepID=UPI0032ED3B5F
MADTTPAPGMTTADIMRVMELLPHRYPMLLIDRIINIDGDKSSVGIKNVTVNEPHFQGHFPGMPVMPGVLIVEAMAQTAGATVMNNMGTVADTKTVYFMTIDGARFRKPVVPGDVLELHVSLLRSRGPVWKYTGKGIVDGTLVAEAEFSAMIADRDDAQGTQPPKINKATASKGAS